MFVRHITLTTGHVRDSLPDEVPNDTRARLLPLIERALTGEHTPVPSPDVPITLTGGAHGRCVSLTVWGPPLSRIAFPDADESAPSPIVEVGIAPHSRCGAVLWRALHDTAARLNIEVRTDIARCPPEPWVAALLYPGISVYPEAAHWLGDLERCLAWAWVEP